MRGCIWSGGCDMSERVCKECLERVRECGMNALIGYFMSVLREYVDRHVCSKAPKVCHQKVNGCEG